MCDYNVHRCRLFNYIPSAIQCLVYNEERGELAVSRIDGRVEIWETKYIWFQKLVIPGNEHSNIQALVWLGRSLFSGGLKGNILQYDLTKAAVKVFNINDALFGDRYAFLSKKIKNSLIQDCQVGNIVCCSDIQDIFFKLYKRVNQFSTDSYGGAVWCLASSAKEDKLVAGCEDGSLKLFEFQNKKLAFKKSFSKQEGRILSVAWHQDDDDIIVSGSCDLIRIWSVKTGHTLQKITLERITKNSETIVWSVLILRDYTVVSGDSCGRIQFFNGKNATLLQSFLVQKADVLCLKASKNEDLIFASGIDPHVIEFKLLHNELDGKSFTKWMKGRALQKHTHDVRAISTVNDFVVSGGMDTNLLIRSTVANSGNFHRIPAFPFAPLISCADDLTLFTFQYSQHLDVWYKKLSETHEEDPIKVLQIKTPLKSSQIVCSSISGCGSWIVYSTSSFTRLFKLERDGFTYSIERVNTGLISSHKVIFSPDSKLLIASLKNYKIGIVQLNKNSNEASSVQLLSVNSVDCVTHLLSISSDSRFLATANLKGTVQVHDLLTMTHSHTLPIYPQVPTSIAFHPQTNDLMVVYDDLQVFEFSLTTKQYTEWTKTLHQNDTPILLELNKVTSNRKSNIPQAITNILFNTKNDCVLFISTEGICTLSKGKHGYEHIEDRFFRNFEHLLHCQFSTSGSLFVVERPSQEIWNSLPPNLYQKKFGM